MISIISPFSFLTAVEKRIRRPFRHKLETEVKQMAKRKANHVIPGMNAAKAQGMGAGYNEKFSNEPLTEAQRQNNKKRKKNQ
ncbi:Spore coat protein K [Geobacillus thermodenitrificans NG80-2]|nr:Spore coat protein K [Geobacillus thermodenitrificans NG80-2]